MCFKKYRTPKDCFPLFGEGVPLPEWENSPFPKQIKRNMKHVKNLPRFYWPGIDKMYIDTGLLRYELLDSKCHGGLSMGI